MKGFVTNAANYFQNNDNFKEVQTEAWNANNVQREILWAPEDIDAAVKLVSESTDSSAVYKAVHEAQAKEKRMRGIFSKCKHENMAERVLGNKHFVETVDFKGVFCSD